MEVIIAVLGGLVTWEVTKRLQYRPYVFEQVVVPLSETLRAQADELQRFAPVNVGLIQQYAQGLAAGQLPTKVRNAIHGYSDLCGVYNKTIDEAQMLFFSKIKERLQESGVPIQEQPPFPGGITLGLQWISSEFDVDHALSGTTHGFQAEAVTVGGSTSLYAIRPEVDAAHRDTIRQALRDVQAQLQGAGTWQRVLSARRDALSSNRQLLQALSKS